MNLVDFSTADLYDENESDVQVALPGFLDYGARKQFFGSIATLRIYEDNSLVRTTLEEAGDGRVLVIDGYESRRCALVGDRLAQLACNNNWTGIIVSGCIRDAKVIGGIDIGIKALGTTPRKSVKRDSGEKDIPVSFSGVTFTPGEYVYADEDGILISTRSLF